METFDKERQEAERISQIVKEILKQMGVAPQDDIWVNGERAQEILDCKRTQLYLLKSDPSTGIVYSKRNKKNIMYLKQSLLDYLANNIVT